MLVPLKKPLVRGPRVWPPGRGFIKEGGARVSSPRIADARWTVALELAKNGGNLEDGFG